MSHNGNTATNQPRTDDLIHRAGELVADATDLAREDEMETFARLLLAQVDLAILPRVNDDVRDRVLEDVVTDLRGVVDESEIEEVGFEIREAIQFLQGAATISLVALFEGRKA